MKFIKVFLIIFILFNLEAISLAKSTRKIAKSKRVKTIAKSRLFGITKEHFKDFITAYISTLILKWSLGLMPEIIESIKRGLATMIDTCSEPAWEEYSKYMSKANEGFINIINHLYKENSNSRLNEFQETCSSPVQDNAKVKKLSQEVKTDLETNSNNVLDQNIKKQMTDLAYQLSDGWVRSGSTVCQILFENSNSYTAPIVAAFNAVAAYLECGKNTLANQLKVDLIIKAAKIAAANLIGKTVWANIKLIYKMIAATYNGEMSMYKLGELFGEHTYTIIHPLATKKMIKKHKIR